MTDERIYFYNNNDNAVESVTFAGEGFTKVVTQGKLATDSSHPDRTVYGALFLVLIHRCSLALKDHVVTLQRQTRTSAD